MQMVIIIRKTVITMKEYYCILWKTSIFYHWYYKIWVIFYQVTKKLSEVMKDKIIPYRVNLLCYGVGSFGQPIMNSL